MPANLYLARVLYIRRYDAAGRKAECVIETAEGRKLRTWLDLADVPAGTHSRRR